jgi:hypothetical protein
VADLATAKEAADLDGKITAARAALDKVDAKKASREADPQGAALTRSIRRFVPIDQDTVSDAVHTLFALAIEFASGFGLLLVLGHHGSAAPKPADPEPIPEPEPADEPIRRFHHERVRPVQGGRIFASDMHAGFCSWCRDRGPEAHRR